MGNQQSIPLTDSQLWEIVGDLQIGNRIFYNKKTGEVKSLIDLDSYGDILDEMVDEWNELEADRDNYIEIINMDSTTAFEMMEEFLEIVEDKGFKSRLESALSRRKPFANFKMEVENSERYRDQWFDYRNQKMKIFVLKQLYDNLYMN